MTIEIRPLLDNINCPSDLREIPLSCLDELAGEIRREIVNIISHTGGHLGSNLGVVELTIALHYVFNTPHDRIVWDVSHQVYTHKLLTGRRSEFNTIRQKGGISGFSKRDESIYDCFDAGHGGTSISVALGMARSAMTTGESSKVISVIGDGSLSSGMALEALNDAGQTKDKNLIVILNDNGMSISPNVGGLSNYLADMRTRQNYLRAKNSIKDFLTQFSFGNKMINSIVKTKRFFKRLLLLRDINWFENLGFIYYGPISGHDLPHMIRVLSNIKQVDGPILLHVITEKGKGYSPAEESPSLYHGVTPFDPVTGSQKQSLCKSYTDYFADALCKIARKDKKVVAITAAMTDGTGVYQLSCMNPSQVYDVGMAEEHAVTLAAGMAVSGFKPIVAIYSTFLQRAYDQIVHDVALTKLPVIFALDRAGVVGGDGPTHQGIFDLSYMQIIPNMTVMAPANGKELSEMMELAVKLSSPVAIRYPKECADITLYSDNIEVSFGRGVTLFEERYYDVAIIAVGSMVSRAVIVAKMLKDAGIKVNVFNSRFVKPLDCNGILEFVKNVGYVCTIEENILRGGFGSEVVKVLAEHSISNVVTFGIDDFFPQQGTRDEILDDLSLTSVKITEYILEKIQIKCENGSA